MSSVPDVVLADEVRDPDLAGDTWTLFVVCWAIAVLFHLAGNFVLEPAWGRAVLGTAAVGVLARPRLAWTSMLLSLAVLTNVWLEAPVLGNHWLLHGLVALVVAGSVAAGRGRVDSAMVRMGGPLRLTLLAFYGFAAFAKLNADFFDPTVSCALFYLRESAASWSGSGLVDDLPSWAETAVIVLVAAMELSIPVLLIRRRTRNVGVAVALAFHYVLAFDRSHQFFDFSSLLMALFLLFLDPTTISGWFDRSRRARARLAARWASGPELVHLLVLGGLLAMVGAASVSTGSGATDRFRDIGVAIWLVYGAVGIVAVVRAIERRPEPLRHLLSGADQRASRWLLLVPAITVLNGVTPYLEVKTGYGWNMYSNLEVVDGESNHFVVRAGRPLTSVDSRLVAIAETDDPELGFYVRGDWLLPERQLLDHLADRPGVTVSGSIDGRPVRYRGGGGGARPAWQEKFQVFRAVDGSGSTRCQPSFGPAR